MLELLTVFTEGQEYNVKLKDKTDQLSFKDGHLSKESLLTLVSPEGLLSGQISYDEHPLKVLEFNLSIESKSLIVTVRKA